MGGNHADGRGLFFFDQGQGVFRDELFQHDRFGTGQRRCKVGQGSGCPAGMRGNRHGDVILVKAPDAHPPLGSADTGGGGPFHEFGQSGGARSGGQQSDIPDRIQPSFFKDIFINGFFGGLPGQLGQRIGVLRSRIRHGIVKKKNIFQIRKPLLQVLIHFKIIKLAVLMGNDHRCGFRSFHHVFQFSLT